MHSRSRTGTSLREPASSNTVLNVSTKLSYTKKHTEIAASFHITLKMKIIPRRQADSQARTRARARARTLRSLLLISQPTSKAVTNYLLYLCLPGPTLDLWIHHLDRVSELRWCVGDNGYDYDCSRMPHSRRLALDFLKKG
jgi:hypothetical protein